MADAFATIGSTQINTLISQLMVLEREPVASLQTQKDQVEVRRGLYVGAQSGPSAFRFLVDGLTLMTYEEMLDLDLGLDLAPGNAALLVAGQTGHRMAPVARAAV